MVASGSSGGAGGYDTKDLCRSDVSKLRDIPTYMAQLTKQMFLLQITGHITKTNMTDI